MIRRWLAWRPGLAAVAVVLVAEVLLLLDVAEQYTRAAMFALSSIMGPPLLAGIYRNRRRRR